MTSPTHRRSAPVTAATPVDRIEIILENQGLNLLNHEHGKGVLSFNPARVNVFQKSTFAYTLVDFKLDTFCGTRVISGYGEDREVRVIPVNRIKCFTAGSSAGFSGKTCELYVK